MRIESRESRWRGSRSETSDSPAPLTSQGYPYIPTDRLLQGHDRAMAATSELVFRFASKKEAVPTPIYAPMPLEALGVYAQRWARQGPNPAVRLC